MCDPNVSFQSLVGSESVIKNNGSNRQTKHKFPKMNVVPSLKAPNAPKAFPSLSTPVSSSKAMFAIARARIANFSCASLLRNLSHS